MTKKRIVVLGAGESGVGAAILAQKKGYDVFVSDFGKIKDNYRKNLKDYNIDFEEQKHTPELILNADEIIKSPGIPDSVQIIKNAEEKRIGIIDEIEFASRFTNAKIIAITGSNGKTTTTLLTYHILKKAGLNVAVGGNVGNSFALLVAENHFDYYVLEISSFQLDRIYTFSPYISVITNITPDHLDRYNYSFENYIRSKISITKNQKPNCSFIFNADDEVTKKYINETNIKAKQYSFRLKKK
jgi:UDP-N-acetylmuramoylalanine--D-glutamate ligase